MAGMEANALLLLVVINTCVLLVFAVSLRKSQRRNWRSLGVLPAFLVALFAEMYGFPLTIYFLSGWLASLYPRLDPFSYSAGQLWNTLFGLKDASLVYSIYLLSYVLIAMGFVLVAWAWSILYMAQRNNQIARTGPYSVIRHPQYVGFILVMLGTLLVWPALSTVIMFPILLVIYTRLASSEEKIALQEFGDDYRRYMRSTSAFFPWCANTAGRH